MLGLCRDWGRGAGTACFLDGLYSWEMQVGSGDQNALLQSVG